MPVLMYHAVGTARDTRFDRWVVPPGLLKEQLQSLVEAGYALVSMTEWAERGSSGQTAVVTFDDGYRDFAEEALPILESLGARATVYVATGFLGKSAGWLPFEAERNRPMMSWGEVREVADRGIEIGSHGHRHIELDVAPYDLARSDIWQSRDALVDAGLHPQSFAYPFGYTNDRVRQIVVEAGFTTACIVGRGLFSSDGDPLRVRRLIVDSHTSPEALLRRFDGPAVSAATRLLETGRPTWRFVRRLRRATRPVPAD